MKKILVIDDEETIRETISVLLKARGFDVVTAADGLAGVKVARAHKPDLVISDITMEPVDGFMTLSIIKQLPGTGRIPFILVTGNKELETMRKGLVLGADDYLTKPFTPTELLDTVNTQLKRRDADIEAAVEEVRRLREVLTGPGSDPIAEALADIRGSAERIGSMGELDEEVRALGNRIAARARGLRQNFAHAGLLTQIEVVAANPDALNVLRRAEGCDLADILDAECRQAAERFARRENLVLHLSSCHVSMGSAALSRLVEELIANAFTHSVENSEVAVKCRVSDQSVQVSFENEVRGRSPRGLPGVETEEAGNSWPDFDKGYGLRFVRRLVQVHGGNFGVVPRSRTMVAVQVELPLVSAAGRGE